MILTYVATRTQVSGKVLNGSELEKVNTDASGAEEERVKRMMMFLAEGALKLSVS